MTTTGTYQGLQGERNTSRVLQPPGGGSSNIFGTDPVQGSAPARAAAPPSNNIFGPLETKNEPPKARENTADKLFGGPGEGQDSPSKKQEDEVPVEPLEQVEEIEEPHAKDEGPSPAQSAQTYAKRMQQGTGNPITGEVNDHTPPVLQRVRQPPGGTSTKLW